MHVRQKDGCGVYGKVFRIDVGKDVGCHLGFKYVFSEFA